MGPVPLRVAKISTAAVLSLSMVALMGAVPANAAPDATGPTPQATATAPVSERMVTSTPSAAPSASAETTKAAVPSPTVTASASTSASASAVPVPARAVPTPTDPGAYMGQGTSKRALGLNPAVAMPMSALLDKVNEAAPAQALASPGGVPGMDVSGWQADPDYHATSQVNWSRQYALGARFVYAKATQGNYFIDASRTSHLRGAAAVGMLQGAYHFAIPSQSSAVAQADYFAGNGGSWSANGTTLPPLLDIENNPYSNPAKAPYFGNNCYNMTPSAMVAWIKAFSNRMLAKTGRLPMIYTNYYWWQECTGNTQEFANQPLHIAAYTNSAPWIPGGWQKYSVWQYSDSGVFDGDSNVFNGSLADLKAFAKGSGATPAPAPKPSIPSPADLVAADSAGILWDYPATGSGSIGVRKQIGAGWLGLRSLNVIDWNADGTLDIVAQWKSGSVTMYAGLASGGFASPQTLASSGWGGYQLTIGYWLKSSNRPQVLAKSSDGALRIWNNNAGSLLTGGTLIGNGWGQLNTTMIDFDGDGNSDLLAQDPAGNLWLYRSNGAGTFINEARAKIGSGWGSFTSLTVYSDFASPGSNGLIARTGSGALMYYPVPGNSRFGASTTVGSGFGPYLLAGGETINGTPPPVTPPPATKPPVTQPPVAPKPAASIKAASDVVAADAAGRLWRYPMGKSSLGAGAQIGTGFAKTKSLHVTDWNADGVLDLLVQWADGRLTLYKGAAAGGFTGIALAASGWSGLDMTVGQWVKGAKYPGIIARTDSGDLLSYTTANGTSMTAGTVIARGLTRVHPALTDFDGDGNADILGTDNIGRLILFRSNGKGSLISEKRAVVGIGWNGMGSLSAANNATAAGSSGLLARTTSGILLYYPITKSRFGSAVQLATGWGALTIGGSAKLATAQAVMSTSDVVSADADGILWNHSVTGAGTLSAPYPIGTGWKSLKSLTVVDWNADGVPDVLTQWANGAMTLYPGIRGGGFGKALSLAASGWAGITFTAGSWTSDSRFPGLVGTNAAGDLFHWPNKSGTTLSAAQKIGIGWGTLRTTMADFDADGKADLLAVDPTGRMWLYRGTGKGAFVSEPRPVIGIGWGSFTQIGAVTNFSGIGSRGVLAHSAQGQVRYYPFKATLGWGAATSLAYPVTGLVVSG
ncbi:MAG: GH25 family lysozyme [Specibacter sp.]